MLAENPKKIAVKYLERFPEFIEFRQRGKEREKKEVKHQVTGLETNPEEALEAAYQELQENLASELLIFDLKSLKDESAPKYIL